MAAVAELSFLLFALINNIHAEERIFIERESDSFTFRLPEDADSCLISRFVGEEKLVLWNTSALWSQNSTVPEDLKQRLSVVTSNSISSYMIQNLTHSDSVRAGETVDLPCEGAADNLDIQWLKSDSGYWTSFWTRVFEDSVTSVMDNVEGRSQEVKTSSGLRIYNLTLTKFNYYACLVMNQQQCVSSHSVQLNLLDESILHTVGETAVLQCPAAEFTDDQLPLWRVTNVISSTSEAGKNYSLVVSSLQLNDSGYYDCEIYNHFQRYYLVVCPKPGPPAVELFSEGDNVTFRCRGRIEGWGYHWWIKTNQTEDRLLSESNLAPDSDLQSRLSRFREDGLMILSNVSLEDTGEYLCSVSGPDGPCMSLSRTVLKSREPSGMDFTLYTVRSSLLPGLLVILCVVVVAVNQRTRGGEQRPAQTDT
ncbi:uncharacterized protein LOC119030978 [Acanthopagrus latus]|uniref:uncharacterized protein LOC119030978 n=1 Tax=Acanthopagrus latus TaxID=8177 RepID=UPI00187CC27E|nr:uncharacterized protein LOC119030978 [Acanthopagrus latus]